MKVCVFCSSRDSLDPLVFSQAKAFAKELVDRNMELVYGGASQGLMASIADEVLSHGGRAIGIYPKRSL